MCKIPIENLIKMCKIPVECQLKKRKYTFDDIHGFIETSI